MHFTEGRRMSLTEWIVFVEHSDPVSYPMFHLALLSSKYYQKQPLVNIH